MSGFKIFKIKVTNGGKSQLHYILRGLTLKCLRWIVEAKKEGAKWKFDFSLLLILIMVKCWIQNAKKIKRLKAKS